MPPPARRGADAAPAEPPPLSPPLHAVSTRASSLRASQLAQHLGTQYTAMSVLSERIDIVQKYLQAVQAGTVAGDHELLRQIKSLCSRLPAMDTARFNEEFLCEANNSLLVTHMAAITKGTGIVNDIIDKYNTAFDKHSRRRGIF